MFANLDRGQFIELLHQLGSEDDQEVLAAARDLHARVTVAGIGWDELLVPEEEEYEDDEYEYEDEDEDDDVLDAAHDPDDEDQDTEPAGPGDDDETPLTAEEKTEALGLIDKLAQRDLSAATKEELAEYKRDIADGDFVAMDLRYLRALHKRLTN